VGLAQAKGKSQLGDNFFEEIGGFACLERVHNLLYEKLYAHPWLKGFFVKSKLEIVKSQQNDFWAALMGGPSRYGGRSPRDAHVHMFLPAEVFAIRHELLGESLKEAGVPEALRETWLEMDTNFEKAVVNKSPDECHGRYRNEEVIIVARPDDI
jgi:truncated hemoglobin YjbI